MNVIPAVKKVVTAYAAQDERILAVYLLGSVARGQQRPDSDIDIGLLLEPGPEHRISAIERTQIANELSVTFTRTVDIGEISSKNLVYSYEALLTGIPLYKRDEYRADLARANLLGMYLQFNIDRREVLDAYSV